VPVLLAGDPALTRQFQLVLDILQRQGSHTLAAPLAVLPLLCRRPAEALAYLNLVQATFEAQLPYERCLHWIHRLPREVRAFPAGRRVFLCAQTQKLMARDPGLAAGFLEGLAQGVLQLDDRPLAGFVAQGLRRAVRSPGGGRHFLALESDQGRAAFAARRVTVTLDAMCPVLGRYLRARLGAAVGLHSLEALPGKLQPGEGAPFWACCDGKTLYLPAKLDIFGDAGKNRDLYKLLAKLEAGTLEGGTFDFDYERAAARLGWPMPESEDQCAPPPVQDQGDLTRFVAHFADSRLALDLFTLFEHARLNQRLFARYPGLGRQLRELLTISDPPPGLLPDDCLVGDLYRRVALAGMIGDAIRLPDPLEPLVGRFQSDPVGLASVEALTPFVAQSYALLEGRPPEVLYGAQGASVQRPAVTALGRRILPGLYLRAFGSLERELRRIQSLFQTLGRQVPGSVLRRRLKQSQGRLSDEDLDHLWTSARPGKCRTDPSVKRPDWRALGFDSRRHALTDRAPKEKSPYEEIFSYREWDCQLNDYLHDHVRVRVDQGPLGEGAFYGEVLVRRRGLILGMRRAFEMLKPQGLSLLRQWPEGDEFDYRAMIDFALDRRAGRSPSERLYIKRVKALRDVAVLVLVDASRSTAHTADGGRAAVLDVEKEALVLFGEALQVLGDQFAVAAFSGSGRLGVDFWWLKTFATALDGSVQARIAGLQPQRNTRMGAAIRHATHCLAQVPAKVRLLIIIGDGFPNDLEYKQGYAIADTRRAIAEARARHVHSHAVTVNTSGDPQLDALYGRTHHNTISDVRELPDKLLRIYGALTR
jgi:Mg-chelatase subunit ChlD